MYNKKILFVFLFSLVFLFAIIFWLNQNRFNSNPDDVQVSRYVSNKTWGVDFKEKVFFKKGDELEYVYVIRNITDKLKKININKDALRRYLGWEDLQVDMGDEYIGDDEASFIKITGKAGDAGDTSTQDVKDFIQLQDIDEDTDVLSDTQEEFKPEQSEKIDKQDIEIQNISFDLNKKNLISNIDNFLEVQGQGISELKSIGIGEKFFNIVSKGGKYYILIRANSFGAGQYLLTALTNNDQLITTDHSVSFTYTDKDIIIQEFLPRKIKNDIARWITVQGQGFEGTLSVQLSNNQIFTKADFQIVSDKILALKIPKGLALGEYSINIMTFSGISEFPEYKFQIVE